MQPNITFEITKMVREFMLAFEQPIFINTDHTPCEVALFRSELIKEEAKEYGRARMRSDEELDAICDLLYVVIGTAITMSVPVAPIMLPALASKTTYTEKPKIWSEVLAVTQDLDSRFPCKSIQFREINTLICTLVAIAECYNYKLLPAFHEVHRSNMGKLWSAPPTNTDGLLVTQKGTKYLVKSESGKVLKPPTFAPPNLKAFL